MANTGYNLENGKVELIDNGDAQPFGNQRKVGTPGLNMDNSNSGKCDEKTDSMGFENLF